MTTLAIPFPYGGVPSQRRRGSLLVIVLWVAFGLISLAVLFGHTMMLEYRVSDNTIEAAQARAAVDGMSRYLQAVLLNNPEPGFLPDPTTYATEAVPIGDALCWVIGRDPAATGVEDYPAFGLVDESAKINLNTAPREMLEALLEQVIPSEDLAPSDLATAILQWRGDETADESGGVVQDYGMLDTPYSAKGAPFETIGELRLVYGFVPLILLGEDANWNGILDPNEDDGATLPPVDDGNGQLWPGIWEYVTVFSATPADATTGQAAQRGLINVNTAPRAVLQAIPGIGEQYAQALVDYRVGKSIDDLRTIDWVSQVLDGEALTLAQPYLTTQTYQFSADIVAVGRNGRGMQRVRFVYDTRSGTPKIIFRQDLTRLGWPLGTALRQALDGLSREAATGATLGETTIRQ